MNAYNEFNDIPGFAKVVDNESLLNNGSLISIQSYVLDESHRSSFNLSSSVTELDNASKLMHKSYTELLNLLS